MRMKASFWAVTTLCFVTVAASVLLPSTASPGRGGQPRKLGQQQSSSVVGAGVVQTTPSVASNSKNQFLAYGHLPMRFEENVGQTDGQVRFLSRGPGYTLFLTSGEAVFKRQTRDGSPQARMDLKPRFMQSRQLRPQIQTSVLRMRLIGANTASHISGVDKIPTVTNYFIGHEESKWHTHISNFAKVKYENVYSGIDLEYYGTDSQLEYDFIVKPGADPKMVRIGFEGADLMSLNSTGDVSMGAQLGVLRLKKPVIYQIDGGQRKLIQGNYFLQGGQEVGINVGTYDSTQPLIIDPVLAYSTYLGGSAGSGANAAYGTMAVDQQGNAYLTGWTGSTDFPIVGTSISPTPHGDSDAFVAKLNAAGTALVYSTYLGGTSEDYGAGLALDSNGYAYVTGITFSTDFPVTTNAYQSNLGTGSGTGNAYLSKLSADGRSLLYSTYLGGGNFDEGQGVVVDGSQNAYITGLATSGSTPRFPTTSNAYQSTLHSANGNAFVARIDTTQSGANSLVYSSFFGGSTQNLAGDSAISIALGSNHQAYITGYACSSDFPITQTAYKSTVGPNCSAFLSQLDTSASSNQGLIYSTFLGGTRSNSPNAQYGDAGTAVALGPNQHAYIAGYAVSSDFPVTTSVSNSTNGKDFVAAFDTTKSQSASLIYSTLVGGSGGESIGSTTVGLAIDGIGNAYIGGNTKSTDFPVTSNAIKSSLGTSGPNEYLAVLSPNASTILYGTYLGGSGSNYEWLSGLALDNSSNIYLSGMTGSSNFQTTAGALQTSLAGAYDGFVMKLTALPVPMISSLSSLYGPPGAAITISGANFGSTQSTSTVTFGGTTATITSWSATSIVAVVPGVTPGLVQVNVNTSLEASNSVPFLVTSTPVISSLSSSTGAPGLAVTITGSGFGSGQGSNTVTFNGTAATATSWGNTQVVVHVPSGATTGNIVLSVAGVNSNGASFTVVTPPRISASASPSPNGSGWNNVPVTVTFTCTAGGLSIASCPSPQTVSSEGANQVVSGTVTDTAGDTATANVTINLDRTLPSLVVSSPADGASFSSSPTTVSGTLSDALSGVSSVTCDGSVAALTSGNFSCNISLNTGVNLVVVRGTDVAGNVAGSNFHVSLTGSLPAATSLQVTPTGVNMVVGNTQQFTVVDQQGRPRTDATWTVDNTSIATIDTNSSPTLTAVAVGQATLTATVGTVTAQTQVHILSGTSLPAGTLLWSVPSNSIQQIVQAQSIGDSPDLYSVAGLGSSGVLVGAFTADGQQKWTTQLAVNAVRNAKGMPDNNGGILVQALPLTGSSSLTDLDAQTGAKLWEYDFTPLSFVPGGMAIGANGKIYLRASLDSTTSALVSLDGATGMPLSTYRVPKSTFTSGCNGQNVTPSAGVITDPFIGSDGSVYANVAVIANSLTGCGTTTASYTDTLSLLKMAPDGTTSLTQYHQYTTTSSSSGPNLTPLAVIPDGTGGVLAPWFIPHNGPIQEEYHIAHITSGGGTSDFNFPFLPDPSGMVLGDNGVAYASGLDGRTNTPYVAAFDPNSGSIQWSSTQYNGVRIIDASAGGGFVGKVTDNNTGLDTVVRFSSTGSATADSWTGSGVDYYIGNEWTGFPSSQNAVLAYSAAPVALSGSVLSAPDAEGTKQATADIVVTGFSNQGPNQTTIISVLQKIQAALPSNSTCNGWLQGAGSNAGSSASQLIPALLAGNSFGHGVFNGSKTAALAGSLNASHNPTNIPNTASFTVNDIGAFFNATDSTGQQFHYGPRKYAGQSLRAQSSILIHEIAHILTVGAGTPNPFLDENGLDKIEKANNKLVDQHCRQLIEGLQ